MIPLYISGFCGYFMLCNDVWGFSDGVENGVFLFWVCIILLSVIFPRSIYLHVNFMAEFPFTAE